jgi:hypothetical protein
MCKGIDALNNLLLEISEVVIDEKTMLPGFKLPKHQCERIEIIKKELRALDILKKHNLLNLGLLDEYNDYEYEDYADDTDGTTDYLEYEEFRLLKEVLENE